MTAVKTQGDHRERWEALREKCYLPGVPGEVRAGCHCSHSYLCLEGNLGLGFRILLWLLTQVFPGLLTCPLAVAATLALWLCYFQKL